MRRADKRKFHFIYKTICLVTGKYYVGMHSTDDKDDGYLGSGLRLRRSVKKYGAERHVRKILEDCSVQGRKHLYERETFHMNSERLNDPLCMNLATGGKGAPVGNRYAEGPWTDERRQAFSQICQGRKVTEETKRKISLTLKGRSLSDVQRRKISQGVRHYVDSNEHHGMGTGNSGKKFSKETCRKMSESQKRRWALRKCNV